MSQGYGCYKYYTDGHSESQKQHFEDTMRIVCRQLTKVSERGSLPASGRVAVVDASHVQQLLRYRGAYDAGTTWRRDQTHQHTTALAGHLRGTRDAN